MPEARMLPVILLLDVSGSMSYDAKMDELNNSVREMIESFQKEQIVQAEIWVSVITFGNEAKVHTQLTPARDIHYTDLVAGGMTYMGRALDTAYDMIEDRARIPKNAYRPVVVLVSDGAPNDDHWEDKLRKFTTTGRSSKCDRWSMAIGADADLAMMKRFLDHPEKEVCFVEDAADIHKFFRFISSCTIQRGRSSNPNQVADDVIAQDILNYDFDMMG
ncbi:MAG: VWA domain-containing protein [Lachnospiraceae bacterium]|nr:VWA domain-containing protein [Lachnospiraceae bacterium]